MIIHPNGIAFASRTTHAMTADQAKWFLDAETFLKHVPQLWTLNLRVFCLRCWKHKLKDHVTVRFNEATETFWARCECSQVEGRLPRANVVELTGTDELLAKLGWSLCCTGRCASEQGFSDGVEANNDPTGGLAKISCGCTERVYVFPKTSGLVV